MFGRSKSAKDSKGIMEPVSTVIGKESNFIGTLRAAGSVRIDGQFSGEILGSSDVIVGETGRVEATIDGRNILIAGTVQGNIEATGRLEISSTGKLFGDLTAAALVIDEGALFHGTSKTEKPMRAKDTYADAEEVAMT
ncbi:bactofilin family protein [Heliophilum fasciatum]|uniref:Polymer-forming protein n=1 Tax=Heliophilum fasciatum TaxID=35700 RepID=A0A4R2RMJ4_9FIRM|nr:polymer-forming cytoskeletal protein [Heliophilum fasciatum]MCW2278265.1 cytoskeletal protein CcmA (bactofilin family) [Heliophilum fasciatum]TCP63889.1 polymer-forming protein [Heliophilum fasciatum]